MIILNISSFYNTCTYGFVPVICNIPGEGNIPDTGVCITHIIVIITCYNLVYI